MLHFHYSRFETKTSVGNLSTPPPTLYDFMDLEKPFQTNIHFCSELKLQIIFTPKQMPRKCKYFLLQFLLWNMFSPETNFERNYMFLQLFFNLSKFWPGSPWYRKLIYPCISLMHHFVNTVCTCLSQMGLDFVFPWDQHENQSIMQTKFLTRQVFIRILAYTYLLLNIFTI